MDLNIVFINYLLLFFGITLAKKRKNSDTASKKTAERKKTSGKTSAKATKKKTTQK